MNIAVIGAGNRARKYLSCLPGGVFVRYVVEPDRLRLSLAAKHFNIPQEGCFTDSEAFFEKARDIDAVIVAAPDRLHVPLALRAVERGWHVLLEKPVASSADEYRTLEESARKAGVQVGVCLEMRFHPYFRRIKELVDSGAVGKVLEVEHTEHIGPDRMAHTFVRGLWSRKEDSGPIFLSKCCHDADFLLWLTGGSVVSAESTGRLDKFVPNAEKPLRCTGCPDLTCPYSAVRLYHERREWVDGFDVPEGSSLDAVIDAELASGRYGRCVYHCDNDVFDSQDVKAVLSNGVKLNIRLEGASMEEGRETIIRGTSGPLAARGGRIILPDGTSEDYSDILSQPLHGGADRALVEAFFTAIESGHPVEASLSSAFEGHRLCYLAG